MINVANLDSTEPEDLIRELDAQFRPIIPEQVITQEDLYEAQRTLSALSTNQVFLENLALHAEMAKRSAKERGADKATIEKAMQREKIVSQFASFYKTQAATLSRMCTIQKNAVDMSRMMNDFQ